MRNKNKAGFTLIELLVVIAIIGLLASVVLLALNSARAKSRDAKRIADIRELATAMELYFNDKGFYPTGTAGTLSAAGAPGNLLAPNYIGQVPTSPTPPDGSCAGANTQGGNDYYWAGTGGSGASYTITFCLGNVTGGYSQGPHTLTPQGIQ